MRVSGGSDTFEFRSPHGMKAAQSRLRTFAGIAVRHLQHFNHPGRVTTISGGRMFNRGCPRFLAFGNRGDG